MVLRDSAFNTPVPVASKPHQSPGLLASKLRGDVVNLQKTLQDHLHCVGNEYTTPQDDEKMPVKSPTKATAEVLAELKEATTLKSDISHCSAVIILPASQWNMISTSREDLEAMT